VFEIRAGSSSLKSASAGVTGVRLLMLKFPVSSSKETSLDVTGARTTISVVEDISSNVASFGVTGANKTTVLKFISLFELTVTPSLLAKIELTWRISNVAKIIVLVFILVYFFVFDEAKVYRMRAVKQGISVEIGEFPIKGGKLSVEMSDNLS